MKHAIFFESPFGAIGVAEENDAVTNVFFGNTVKPAAYTLGNTPLLQEAARQLDEYFQKQRRSFTIPLAPEGTAFELSVWRALQEIPYGETRSYRDIAAAIGNPNACRAVGRANARNPVSLFIPCHRVIGANMRLTGYAGGLGMKEGLLLLEDAIWR